MDERAMDKPHIFLIVIDTMRADHLGCYGDKECVSPNLDALAEDGVIFKNAYSTSNFTAPAFASLFTSLYPAHHGVYDFDIKMLPPSPLLKILGENGYQRKAVVDFGFFKNFFKQSFDSLESLTDLTENWSVEGPIIETKRAMEWIEQNHDAPFFFFLHLSTPHTPYRFPAEFHKRIKKAKSYDEGYRQTKGNSTMQALFPDPENGVIPEVMIRAHNNIVEKTNRIKLGEAAVNFIKFLYRMEIKLVDELLGLLFAKLENLGILGSSIISVSSDHGEQLWDHGSFGHGSTDLYNEIIKTPWIVRYDGSRKASRQVESNVSHINILPTLLDLAGIEMPAHLAVKSVRHLFDPSDGEAPANKRGPAAPVYSEAGRFISVVDGYDKLITASRRKSGSAKASIKQQLARTVKRLGGKGPQLYDLKADPSEAVNRAKRCKERVRELQGLITDYYEKKDYDLGKGRDLSDHERDAIKDELKGLGYL